MATFEERLQIAEFDLKHFKTETIKAYGDMAYEMVIIKGLTEDSIKRLSRLTETVEKRFERVDIRLDGMDAHLESMGVRLNQLETTLSEHTTLLHKQGERLDGIDQRLNAFEQSVNNRFETQDKKLDQILVLLDRLTPKSE